MYVGHITGFIFLPVSILIYLNKFGYLSFPSLFGIDLVLIGALGVIAIEIGDVADSHMKNSHRLLTWLTGLLLAAPSVLYFISKLMTLPTPIVDGLPLIIASFIFVEGISGFFIGEG